MTGQLISTAEARRSRSCAGVVSLGVNVGMARIGFVAEIDLQYSMA